MNKYFRVDRPFRVWCHLGFSDSNTYIGSSRCINTVMEARNAKPGDVIHALVGGTFMVTAEGPRAISTQAPKHIFEKSYGGRKADAFWFAESMKDFVTEIPAPSAKVDYAGVLAKVSANRMRELHPEVIEVEPSPGMVALRRIFSLDVFDLEARQVDFDIKEVDENAYHPARVEIVLKGVAGAPDRSAKFSFSGRVLTVNLPVGEPVQGIPFDYEGETRGTIHLRPETWPDVVEVAQRVLYEFVNRGTHSPKNEDIQDMTEMTELQSIAEKIENEESHAPFLRLQSAVGATDGGLASMHWSGSVSEALCRDLAEVVVKRSKGPVVDHGSPWEALSRNPVFEHSEDLADEPILARNLFLDNVEKRFGVKFGAAERRDFEGRIDAILEPYFEQERSYAEERDEAEEAPKP